MSRFKKGEILARIDPRDFEIRIKKLSAELKAAEARLADAEKDYARQKNLLKESAASQSQYDKTQMLVETTRAGIDSLKADLAAARNALNDTRLAAPFDGVVNRKFTENHESINPGVPVVSLLDISKVEVVYSRTGRYRYSEIGFRESLCHAGRLLRSKNNRLPERDRSARRTVPTRAIPYQSFWIHPQC